MEAENHKYLLDQENLKLEKKLNVFKNKYAHLKILIEKKNDFLAHYGAGNAGKWEKGKQDKIKKMENLLLELKGKSGKAKKKSLVILKNCKC